MSEQDVRDGLWAAVASEPPLSFDPDALMAKAARDLKRRRALVGVGAATTAVAVAAVAVPVLLGSPRGGDGANTPPIGFGSPPSSVVEPPTAANPPTSPSTVDVAWPPPNVTPRQYTAKELVARGAEMQTYLRSQFAKVVLGAKLAKPGTFGGEQSGQVSEGQDYLNAFTVFMMNGELSAVDIYLSAPGGNGPKPCEDGGGCDVKGQPDGSWVVVQKPNDTDGRGVLSVSHFRADGSVVRATGYNYDPTGADMKLLNTLPVTVEQLTALATDSKLSL